MKKVMMSVVFTTVMTTLLTAQENDSLSKTAVQYEVETTPQKSPPIPIEAFAGNKGLVFQMILNKSFGQKSRFGFFTVTNFVGDYADQNQQNQFLSQSFLTANLWKGFYINAGVSLNYMTGFRPSAGLQYVFAKRNFLAVILPRIDLTQTKNFETFGLVEYQPKFNKEWGLYTRIQSLFNQNTQLNFHDRSYVWLRLGASYKNFQFGWGMNIDYYGPAKLNENSFGAFLRTELF